MDNIRKLIDLDRQIRESEKSRQRAEQIEHTLRSEFAEIADRIFTVQWDDSNRIQLNRDGTYVSIDGKTYRVEYYHGVWKLAPIEITHIA